MCLPDGSWFGDEKVSNVVSSSNTQGEPDGTSQVSTRETAG